MKFLSTVASILLASSLLASDSRFDTRGRLERLALPPGWLNIKTDLRAPALGWGKMWGFGDVAPSLTETAGRKFWKAALGGGQTCEVEAIQAARETPTGIEFEFSASALKDSEMEGLIFWIDLPADVFAGGTFQTTGGNGTSGTLPAERGEQRILNSGILESASLTSPKGAITFSAAWSAPVNATIQDSRQWGDNFTLMIFIHRGTLLTGNLTRLNVTIKATGTVEQTPASFAIDSAKTRYKFEALGGNYCFSLEAPERMYTLEHLKPRIARTEISLQDWAPSEGMTQAEKPLDKMPGKLRLELETMRELAVRKIPFASSIWKVPAWICKPHDPDKRRSDNDPEFLKAETLPAAAEAVSSYLIFAKEKFNAEPEWFSFNEPDYGVKVKLNPEEHRQMVKTFGAQFKKAGLKTKMLLGDVSNPRGSPDYVRPTLDDSEVLKYCAALSIHSWGGASAAQYGAWAEAAARAKLPLFVAEAGFDPSAWQGGKYKTFENFVNEMAHYQELFQFARPQAILYWEYTADYSLLNSGKPRGKTLGAADETQRFALQKHFGQFIAPGSDAVEVSGASPYVRVNAFKSGESLSIQVSNTGWIRPVTITGIPSGIKRLNATQTGREKIFEKLAALEVKDGAVQIEAPAESMTTLHIETK